MYNPFKYRGYYYDAEIGFYYLNSRYCDPATGRFINADGLVSTGQGMLGYNMFAYCNNNPVMFFDPYGESFLATLVIAGIVAGAITGFGITMYADYEDDGEVFNGSVNAAEYVGNTLIGGTIGGLTGAAASYITPAIGSFLSSSYILGSVAVGGECVAIAVSGAQIVGAAAVAGAAIVVFASKERPHNNQAQNKQFRDVMRDLNVTDKTQMRRVHDKIKGRNLGYNELYEFVKRILNIE